jgi:hypothetical protein
MPRKKSAGDKLVKELSELLKKLARTRWGFPLVVLLISGLVFYWLDWRAGLVLFLCGITVWWLFFKMFR